MKQRTNKPYYKVSENTRAQINSGSKRRGENASIFENPECFMSNLDMATIKQWNNQLLKDPDTRKAYEDSQNEYQVAHALIRARMKAHMTQTEVAEKMHTSQAAVARYEGGDYLPSLKTIDLYQLVS